MHKPTPIGVGLGNGFSDRLETASNRGPEPPTGESSRMKRIQQSLPDPLFNELEDMAKGRGLNIQDIVREACEDWLHWQKKAQLKEGS